MPEKSSDYTLTYFRFLIGKLKSCIILAFVFALCSYPVYLLRENLYSHPDLHSVTSLLSMLAVLSLCGFFILSFITPLITFKHLYTKTSADNILSLPLTSAQRFFCEAGAAITAFIVPYIIALPPVFFLRASYTAVVGAVLFMMFLVSFALSNIFFMCFCGRLAEAILYPLAFNIAAPILAYLTESLTRSNVYGLFGSSASYSPLMQILFGSTSPAGCLFYYTMINIHGWPVGIATMLILSAALLALAYLVYGRRHVENIGQPFVFRGVYNVNSVIIASAAVIGYISLNVSLTNREPYCLEYGAFAVLAVLLLILMLIMEFVNFKKIHSLPKFLLKYACILAAGILASFGLRAADGFGESYYIPAAGDTEYIEVSAYSASYGNYLSLRLKPDTQLADYIRGEQKAVIDARNDTDPYGHRLTLTYALKSGNYVRRAYSSCRLPENFFETILTSEEYRLSGVTSADIAIARNNKEETGEISMYVYADRMPEPEAVSVRDPYNGQVFFEANISWPKLRDALYTDLKADINYGRSGEPPLCEITPGGYVSREFTGYGSTTFTIYERYTNTVSYLRQLGSIPDARETLDSFLGSMPIKLVVRRAADEDNQSVAAYTHRSSQPLDEFVALSDGEFAEAINNRADYVYRGSGRYAYYLRYDPGSFDADNDSLVDNVFIDQLKESGLLDSGVFMYSEQYKGYTIPGKRGESGFIPINEQYYGVLEKYFSDPERKVIVYSYDAENGSETTYVSGNPVTTAVLLVPQPAY